MLLFAIFLTCFGILNIADTVPPKLSEVSFKKLLDTCTELQNSYSEDCQSFISTYRWLYDEVHLVFDKVLEKNNTAPSPAKNILEARLINLIENPNFNLKPLGLNSLKKTIKRNNERLAIAIWPHLKTYKNDSFDAQLQVCSKHLGKIMRMNMLRLLTKMVIDRPDCLEQVKDPILKAVDNRCSLDIFLFLYDHGVQLALPPLWDLWRWSDEIFNGIVRKYPYYLFEKAISGRYPGLAFHIWELMKRENYSNVLLQICKDNIINAVNDNMLTLVRTMHKDVPECILSKGDILMDIAVRGGLNIDSMILFLNDHGVEITPGLVIKDPSSFPECESSDMIMLLNDIGVKITPEHLHILSTNKYTNTFEWARLHSQLSRETFIKSPIKQEYFGKVIQDLRFDRFKKIVEFNVFEIDMIREFISNYCHDVSANERFISILRDSKIDITKQAI